MSRRDPRSGKRRQAGPGGGASATRAARTPPRGARRAIPLLLIAVGLVAHANSLGGAFLLDDELRIIENPHVRHPASPWQAMAGSARPLVQLALAANHALGGLDVRGYHAFNVAVHLLAGLALYGIVRRMLESDRLRARYGKGAPWLAMAVAAIWLAHPVQTGSVTYVIQRAESLMGLFLLLTLHCVIRGAGAARSGPWYVAAVAACGAGMGSKEVMAVAPLVVLLYDRVFLAASLGEMARRRRGLYAGLAATWLILVASLGTARQEDQAVLMAGLTPWRYALTQPGVIVHYLRLAVWPHPLVLDYQWPLAGGVVSVLPHAAVVLALLTGTLLALRRRWWVGFWGAWFFLILAPTSSVLPLADPAFEHRLYLPLAAVIVLGVAGGREVIGLAARRLGAPAGLRIGIGVALAGAVVATFTVLTIRRNEAYRSPVAMWTDTVARRPENPRARLSLGVALDRQGRTGEAIPHYTEALRLKPDYAEAHSNLGVALQRQARLGEAITHLAEATRLNPRSAEAHRNLGGALLQEGKVEEAIVRLDTALRLKPHDAEAHNNLGVARGLEGRIPQALHHFEDAVRLKPEFAEAHGNLGRALLALGRAGEAVTRLETALRLKPDLVAARDDLRRARSGGPAGARP